MLEFVRRRPPFTVRVLSRLHMGALLRFTVGHVYVVIFFTGGGSSMRRDVVGRSCLSLPPSLPLSPSAACPRLPFAPYL